MRAAQFGIGQTQDGLALIGDRSFGQAEVGSIGISAKGNFARSNFRQTIGRINNRHVLPSLIFKNTQLGRAIIRHGAISIEMIRCKV